MAYTVFVIPQAWQEIKTLPGNMRQRVKHEVDQLRNDPRPGRSKRLTVETTGVMLYRVRLDRWRLVYAISDDAHQIIVLAVRKRPPYNYDDLNDLLTEV